MSDIGDEVKTRREAVGISQRELARLSGVHQVTIANIETGKAENLRLKTIGKLRSALEMLEANKETTPSIKEAVAADGEAFICVPRLDVRVSAGDGCIRLDNDDIIEMMRISQSWLQANVSGRSDSLAILTTRGDSMEPTLVDGDLLLIDRSAQLNVDAIFVFTVKDQLYVKRLQRMPNGNILVISDNKERYREMTIDDTTSDFRILGRVVFVWKGKRV